MICLVPGCGLGAEFCGFCDLHIARLSLEEREHIVRCDEKITGKALGLPPQAFPAQGDLFWRGAA